MRNFGMNVQASLRGDERPPARYGANTHADLNSLLLPSGSILERSDFAQAIFDIRKFLLAFSVVAITGFGLAFALFVLFFVET